MRRPKPGRDGRITVRAMLITLVILITLALIGLTVAGALVGPSMLQAYQMSALDTQSATFLTAPADPEPKTAPYVRGKLVLIDVKKGHLDPFYRQLSDDLVARSADEVGTIVWVDWESEAPTTSVVANTKIPACKLTIIDREHNQSLGVFTFPWDYAYTDARRTMIQVKKPLVAVADYLKSLPRR